MSFQNTVHDWKYESDNISTNGIVYGKNESDCISRIISVLESAHPNDEIKRENIKITFDQ